MHCSLPSDARFCCTGCEAAHAFLSDRGLERYYDLRGGSGVPAALGGLVADDHDRTWLEPIVDDLRAKAGLVRIQLDVQGIHCTACVWLFEELFRREAGGARLLVNPVLGSAELTVTPSFDLARWVATIERLGYRLGPYVAEKHDEGSARSDLVWRMGICIALAMNSMIFAVAFYCGLDSGPTYALFQRITVGLSTLSLFVGGPVFFRSAWSSLRARALHLDVPIALGILLAYASSLHAFFMRGGASSFFDTISVFIALMLVGRFLQDRVLARNRASILASSGAEHVLARRVAADGSTAIVRATEIQRGDRLLVARGDLVPVDSRTPTSSTFSLDWINGESAPTTFASGATVPAGAFACGESAVVVEALGPFKTSALARLLCSIRGREQDVARSSPFWSRLTGVYVGAVLSIATLAFGFWVLTTKDLARAVDVVAAILIVTCPCAFGIATPLAYELAQAGLRRAGLFVRSPAFLDRAAGVRTVVFDKTGTLTTGALRVANPEVLDALEAPDRAALYDLAASSAHPKSVAIARALGSKERIDACSAVTEEPGRGTSLVKDGHVFCLGSPRWTAAIGHGDVSFTRDGRLLASIVTAEKLRPDAALELRRLERRGIAPWILSGDTAARVHEIADACGIPHERALGGESPEGKATFVKSLDHGDLLFVGDGINDALVADAATCSGTPAIDRPFMAARTDFYVVTPGLRPLRLALSVAKTLASVVRRNLFIALAYNVVAVGVAVAGQMSPLLCAVLMPLSSLSTVLATTATLSRRARAWKS